LYQLWSGLNRSLFVYTMLARRWIVLLGIAACSLAAPEDVFPDPKPVFIPDPLRYEALQKKKSAGPEKSEKKPEGSKEGEEDSKEEMLGKKKAKAGVPLSASIPSVDRGNFIFLIVLGALAGLGATGVAVYMVMQSVKRRNRELRYRQSTVPAYVKEGDGRDTFRDML
jgi:hypothetical protein